MIIGVIWGIYRGILENHIGKKMENEMETREYKG